MKKDYRDSFDFYDNYNARNDLEAGMVMAKAAADAGIDVDFDNVQDSLMKIMNYEAIAESMCYANVQDLQKKIMNNLKREGYGCSMDEGVMLFEMNGRWYYTHFWHSSKGLIRAAIIDYMTIDEDWDKISPEGQSVLANYVNRYCPKTKFVVLYKGVLCEYMTGLKHAEDFLPEAKMACNMIGNAVHTAEEALPKFKARYPVNGHGRSIGFVNRQNDGLLDQVIDEPLPF